MEPGRFRATIGPFTGYERTLTTEGGSVTEVVRYRITPGFGAFPFNVFYRRALRRSNRADSPWWAPAEPIDTRAAATIGCLCAVAVVAGYLGTLLTQTLTFAADEFDATKTAQSTTLAVVRIGVLATLVITTLADRRGRRRLLLLAASFGCVACALGALAPNLVAVGASQLAVRTVVSACTVLLTVIAAEEMPAGCTRLRHHPARAVRRARASACACSPFPSRTSAPPHGGCSTCSPCWACCSCAAPGVTSRSRAGSRSSTGRCRCAGTAAGWRCSPSPRCSSTCSRTLPRSSSTSSCATSAGSPPPASACSACSPTSRASSASSSGDDWPTPGAGGGSARSPCSVARASP